MVFQIEFKLFSHISRHTHTWNYTKTFNNFHAHNEVTKTIWKSCKLCLKKDKLEIQQINTKRILWEFEIRKYMIYICRNQSLNLSLEKIEIENSFEWKNLPILLEKKSTNKLNNVDYISNVSNFTRYFRSLGLLISKFIESFQFLEMFLWKKKLHFCPTIFLFLLVRFALGNCSCSL